MSKPCSLQLVAVSVALSLAFASSCSRDPHAIRVQHVQKAERYAAGGKLSEAVIEYRLALEADPQSGETQLALGEVYLRLGDFRNAARSLVRAGDLLPTRVDVQLKAGNLLLLDGGFDDAKVRADKALASEPRNVDAHILMANALSGLRNMEAAVAQIEEAISLDDKRSATYSNLGAIEAGRGRSQAAELAFRRAIELDDNSTAAHLAIANFYWGSGRMPEAEKELRRALAIEPRNVIAQRAMAGFFIASNRLADAEAHIKAIYELTQSAASGLALADYYVAKKDEQSARHLLDALKTRTDGTAAQAKLRLASLDHAAGRREQAYAQVEQLLATDGKNLQTLLTKSMLLLADGRLDDALAAANLAVQSHGDSAAAYHILARIQAARNNTEAAISAYENVLRLNPRATPAQVALAQLHLAAGRSQMSAGIAEEALKKEPANPEARLVLVKSLIAKGELQRAAPELEKLAASYPNSSAVLVQTGILRARRQDTSSARTSFEQALKLDPTSTDALAGLIALDLAAKQPAAARARVEGTLDRPDASVPLLMLAGRTYFAINERHIAEQCFRRILERDATYLQAYVALGQIYVTERRLDAALVEFEQLAKHDPRPVAPLTFAGVILLAQGRTADAQDRFERALQVDPSAAVAANNLAWIYSESGRNLDIALQLAQTAHSKLPEAPEVADTLGFLYYKKNLLPQAIQSLRAAVEKDPTQPGYHYHLGLALAKSGDAAGAKGHLTTALSLKRDFAGSADARNVLQTLDTK